MEDQGSFSKTAKHDMWRQNMRKLTTWLDAPGCFTTRSLPAYVYHEIALRKANLGP